MPLLEQHLTVAINSVRAFLNLRVGVTRDGTVPPWSSRAEQSRELEEARRLLASKDRELAELRARPVDNGDVTEATQPLLEDSPGLARHEAGEPESQDPIRAEQLIWMFGQPRSGSTWLSWMMAELENQERWHEPYVGMLFGGFIYERVKDENLLNNPTFIMGEPYRDVWLGSIGSFILEGAAARYPGLKGDQYLVIKEPNGSVGAPLLMEALPESRMILLVRDPRDVVASSMDARSEGGWNYEKNKALHRKGKRVAANKNPDGFARRRAQNYLEGMGKAKEAYDAHQGPKALVRYEELRADTLGTMKRLYSTLGIRVEEGELARVAHKHSWENLPEEEKGEGKFYRKATPGGWREDLTPEQAEAVERITAPLLSELYPPN